MALRQINLLPWDLLEKSVLLRHLRFWAKCLILAALALTVIYVAQSRWMNASQKTLQSTVFTGDQVAQKINEIGKLQDEIRTIVVKQQTLSSMVQRQMFYDIIALFSNCLNDGTWVDFLSIQRNEKESGQYSLVCQGYSLNHHTLGLFLDRLSAVPIIKNLVLTEANSLEKQSQDAKFSSSVQFNISCKIIDIG